MGYRLKIWRLRGSWQKEIFQQYKGLKEERKEVGTYCFSGLSRLFCLALCEKDETSEKG